MRYSTAVICTISLMSWTPYEGRCKGMGAKISTNTADSRMLDFYDKLLGLGLYAGKQKELNQVLHSNVVPYIRDDDPEYLPAGSR